MSNAGQAVLQIGGFIVGNLIAPGIGGAIGMALGGMAGSALFPTDLGTVRGPRLNDLTVMSSAIGAPIPIVYGTYAVAGNLIWSSGIIETKKKKRQGGKGGPSQTVVTYTYKVNCAVGVCEGPISGYRRIWADTKLIYDARPQQPDELDETYEERLVANALFLAGAELYLGTEDQLPDPTVESYEGVGTTSAYRGLAYVAFSDFQLADYGNRVPSFRFEVSRFVESSVGVLEYSNEVLFPWAIGSNNPADPRNTNQYRKADLSGTWKTFAQAKADIEAAAGFSLSDYVYGWSTSLSTQAVVHPIEGTVNTEGSVVFIWLNFQQVSTILGDGGLPYGGCGMWGTDLQETLVWWSGGNSPAAHSIHGLWWTQGDDLPPSGFPGRSASFSCGAPRTSVWYDHGMELRRRSAAPPDDGNGSWTYDASIYRVLQQYTVTGSEHLETVVTYPLSPARPLGHHEYNDAAFWGAAYADAVASGDMPSGLVYGVDYPIEQAFGYRRNFTGGDGVDGLQVPLGAIVEDVCVRCGLTTVQIDVSDLTELVDGYAITRVMSGRDAISPLRTFGWFDCVESEAVLKWPTRGKAAVATLTADDLAAHAAGDQRPSAVETSRAQEVELPRRLRVHYAQTDKNYEPGEQGASRLAAGDIEVRDVEVAVAMSATKAAQIADVVLYDLWVSRNAHRIVVDHSWLALDPADAITAPIDGRQERLRIVNIDHSLPGLLALDCVRDDDGVYVSYAVAAGSATAGTTSENGIGTAGTADLEVLDLPPLRDADNDAGYYAAIRAEGGNAFGGAVLYRSTDGGTNYESVASVSLEATMGHVTTALPAGLTTVMDEGNTLVVDLDGGELESVTEASLLAGYNAAAIGAPGRWEIIQFQDAAPTSGSPNEWMLTGLLRGRRGTEHHVGTSQAGDRFVLLDTAIARVPAGIALIGATVLHKAVLVGTSIEATTAESITLVGEALEPFSPVHVEGEWQDDGDLVISWIRRGRIGGELVSGADIPLSEESESYEVDVMDGGTVVRTLTASTPTVTYTAAQQAADFGSPAPPSVTVRVYQLSAIVGRGTKAEATL